MWLGQPLHIELGRTSFLLPADIPELVHLEAELRHECSGVATVIPVDDDFVEVSLSGSWVVESREAHEGMFLTVMSDSPEGDSYASRAEFFIYKLWQISEAHISSLT